MMTPDVLIQQLNTRPETTEFTDVINTIDQYYHYTPAKFTNGPAQDCVTSEKGENEGSCKIFSFAQLNKLSEDQTLHCFGQYYRDDVLNNPENNDHDNIRNFIKYGWKGINFETVALKKK